MTFKSVLFMVRQLISSSFILVFIFIPVCSIASFDSNFPYVALTKCLKKENGRKDDKSILQITRLYFYYSEFQYDIQFSSKLVFLAFFLCFRKRRKYHNRLEVQSEKKAIIIVKAEEREWLPIRNSHLLIFICLSHDSAASSGLV